MQDLISRNAAIDEIMKELKDQSLHDDEETSEDFADGYDEGIRNAATRVYLMPSAQPEPYWIPVSERLPEEDDYKSCIECLDGAVWYFTENGTIGLGYYYKSTKEWSTTDDLKTDGRVLAWMPIPEPYRAERRET